MTVVIAALNKQGAALAADSAVTVGQAQQQRIYESADKLFELSRRAPVGVAIYGGTELNGVPWETVLKEFRDRQLNNETCAEVAGYARRLLDWLDSGPFDVPEGAQPSESERRYVKREIVGLYRMMLMRIGSPPGDSQALRIAAANERHRLEQLGPGDDLPADFEERLRASHGGGIEDVREALFRGLLDDELRQQLLEVALLALSSPPAQGHRTGLVMAGFGEQQHLPSLVSWEVSGRACGYVRRRCLQEEIVTEHRPALLVPFAQTRDVRAIIEGVDAAYQLGVEELAEELVGGIVGQVLDSVSELTTERREFYRRELTALAAEKTREMTSRLSDVRTRTFSRPIYRNVAALPKDRLATMAEALVNLTIFKRQLSQETESVGGPVDVAVISRGDGFVWIKRKRYFQADLNPRFGARELD